MYTNLFLCLQEMKANDVPSRPSVTAVVVTNDYLIEAMRQVEGMLETHCEQGFAPRIVSYTLDVDQNTVDTYANRLNLKRPFLTVTSIKVDGTELEQWDGQSTTRSDADYHPTPRRETPFYDLQGLQRAVFIPADERYFTDAIEVEGISCYRKNYPAEGWQDSGDTVRDNPLLVGSTSLTVTNAAESQFGSSAPRFSEGDLLRAGTEFMRVWAVNENTLTVERGVRGSTKAQHAQGVAIEVWRSEPDIVRAATRWTIYMAKRRAIYETMKIDAGGAGQVTISAPTRMPEETEMILGHFINSANQLGAV